MSSGTVNPDIQKYRSQATFDPFTLTTFMDDGAEATKRRRFLQNLAIKEYKQQNFTMNTDQNRDELYSDALKKTTYAFKRISELGLTDPREIAYFRECIFITVISPFNLHCDMLLDTIRLQGTEEQSEKWGPLGKNFAVIGTYAQTELGHGTFLRGLETTATYDAQTKEFIINSPTITSSKFWPGGLGKTANCCVVMARLKMNGKDCGMQSFMVQIRDFETHKPLPGITVGDIGGKFGYASMDNGFLRMNNIRIPRENMLMKFSQVTEDGKFVPPKSDRLVYGSMTLIRVSIVVGSGRVMSKTATIATRYSAVRKQSEVDSGAGENSVIDFQTQQYKVFPQIAKAYAFSLAGKACYLEYLKITAEIENNSLEGLPVLHALSSGLKAFCSWEVVTGMETCRMACGGHGYLLASGIPQIYVNEAPMATYEGENTVLCLQVARFLVKCYEAAKRGEQLQPLAQFLQASNRGSKSRVTDRLEMEHLIEAYEHRATCILEEACVRLNAQRNQQGNAWNNSSQLLVDAALAFTHAFVVKAFAQAVSGGDLPPSTRAVLTQLCQLYALDGIYRFPGDFRKKDFLSEAQLSMLHARMFDLLADIKPNAIALVDAFDIPDHVLNSDLGRYDGNVYEAIMETASKSRLNKTDVHEAYYRYQQPFMKSMNPGVTLSKL